jgi:hypothetical protein
MSSRGRTDIALALGKADAIRVEILRRIRDLHGKVLSIEDRWAMAEWFASKAPDSLYCKILGEIHADWQASMAVERNQSRLALEVQMSEIPMTQEGAQTWCRGRQGKGWRIASNNDFAKLRNQGVTLPHVTFWELDGDKFWALAINDGSCTTINPPDNGCRVVCVREKPKQMTVDLSEQVDRLLGDSRK